MLASASRPPELTVPQVIGGAAPCRTRGVNDHENLGSIFRNAAGLGVDGIVFGVGCADPLYRRAVRVSMGHALLVPYAWTSAWPDDLQMLRDNGFRLLAMTPDPEARTLSDDDQETAVQGVRRFSSALRAWANTERAMQTSDMRVRVPMSRY